MKYCCDCQRNVQPSKKFSFGWFIVNCLWLIGGIVYILYFIFGKKKVCPICGGNHLEASREDIVTTSGETINVTSKEAKQERFEERMKQSNIKWTESGERAKIALAAARQKNKDASAARVLARQQKKEAKLNKTI